jgi:adenylate cyclase
MSQAHANQRKSLQLARRSADATLVKLALPTPSLDGLLALLVTDLEGFTSLVEQLGDAKAQLVIREHDRLLRARMHDWSGHEVAHTGDGFLAAFRSVKAALQCARDMQRTLADRLEDARAYPLRARMGLHAGEPLTEDTRLFGTCMNTAVRVCERAAAQSVLVTDVVKQLAQGHFSFAQGTTHQLKGLTQPVVLYDFAWREHAAG